MKELTLLMGDGEKVNMTIAPIIQLIGQRDDYKTYIVDSLQKHFSKHRYTDEDEHQSNNVMSEDSEVGRGYYKCKVLGTLADLEYELSQQKNALLTSYINNAIVNIDVSYALQKLNDDLVRLSSEVQSFLELENLELDVETVDYELMSLLKSQLTMRLTTADETYLSRIGPQDKFNAYLELLTSDDLYRPERKLIIFNNIDRILDKESYRQLIKRLSTIVKKHDFTFLLTTSKQGYAVINQELIEAICVINDTVFSVDDFEQLKRYVMNHYPYHRELSEELLIELLEPIIHKIGLKESMPNIESQVVLKLLNESENIINKPSEAPVSMALDYIHDV